MKALSIRILASIVPAVLLLAAPVLARDSYVQDGAHMLNQSTLDQVNSEVSAFNGRTGKEVLVVTVPSLSSEPINTVVEKTFAQNQVNGVLIFLAKDEKQGRIVGDKAARAFFPSGTFQNIYDAMRGYLRSGDYDGAVKSGVNLTLDQYRSHEGALGRSAGYGAAGARQAQQVAQAPGKSSFGGISLFWLFVLLIVGFFIIRAIFRAMSGPKQAPPGYGGQLPGQGPMPGPGFGGPGYGPGYGGGGMGGGGFFSGLLGGLGGAFLGNELFGRRDQGMMGGDAGQAGMVQGGDQQDASGWQSDAGQIDSGNSGGGGWGDSGGGWGDAGGGGGDSGGGGGDGGW